MSEIEMNVEEIVRQADQLGASDVHLIKGLPPYFRVVGRLVPQREGRPLTEDDCDRAAAQLAGRQLEQLKAVGEVDLARTMVGRRVRVNLFRQQGSFSAAIRLLADEIPALEKLDLPPKVLELTDLHQGLVLVTGETGSGKSTTLAAMIDKINHTRAAHVLTPRTGAFSTSGRSGGTPPALPAPCARPCGRTRTSSWWGRCGTGRPSRPP